MLIEEEETKPAAEVNPDALEAVFEEDVLDEEILIFKDSGEEDEIDIAFAANDEGYW